MHKNKFIRYFILLLSLLLPLNSFSVYAMDNKNCDYSNSGNSYCQNKRNPKKRNPKKRGKGGRNQWKDNNTREKMPILPINKEYYTTEKKKKKTEDSTANTQRIKHSKFVLSLNQECNKMLNNASNIFSGKIVNVFFVGPMSSGKSYIKQALTQEQVNRGSYQQTTDTEIYEMPLYYDGSSGTISKNSSVNNNLLLRLFSLSGSMNNVRYLRKLYLDKNEANTYNRANIVIFTADCTDYYEIYKSRQGDNNSICVDKIRDLFSNYIKTWFEGDLENVQCFVVSTKVDLILNNNKLTEIEKKDVMQDLHTYILQQINTNTNTNTDIHLGCPVSSRFSIDKNCISFNDLASINYNGVEMYFEEWFYKIIEKYVNSIKYCNLTMYNQENSEKDVDKQRRVIKDVCNQENNDNNSVDNSSVDNSGWGCPVV